MRKRELKRAPGSGINNELHKLFEALRNPDAAVPEEVTTVGAAAVGAGRNFSCWRKKTVLR